jgi:lysophospholipase L1-like esterase
MVIGLGLAEGIARLTYRKPWYERLVGEQNQSAQTPRNRYGLRDRDFLLAKPRDERRVLILGDSFTFGSGVADESAIFPELLERRLSDSTRMAGVSRIDVLNGGLRGSLTRDWLELWDKVSDAYRPDVLLVVFFLRDGTRTHSIPDFFGKVREEILLRNQRSLLYRHSYLFRIFQDHRDRKSVGDQYARAFMTAYFGDEAQTAEWRLAQRNLLRLRDLAREKSVAVGLVIFPVLVELGPNYPFRRICEHVADFARSAGIPVHDLLPDFLGRQAPDLWVSAFDQHPNAQAHRIAAESMYPFVRKLLESPQARAR